MRDKAPVEVIIPLPYRCGPKQGISITTAMVPRTDVTSCQGLPVLTPERTAFDLARRLSTLEAVMWLDALSHQGLITKTTLRSRLSPRRPRERGHARAERAIDLMDPRAESPQESRLRVKLTERDLPPPEAQYVVNDADGFVARVDFAWPDHRVALEYDGEWHTEPTQVDRDRARDLRLRQCGWKVLHITADPMNNDFESVIRAIRAVLPR